MTLEDYRLILDFGLFVFIWSVHLLVYSNFRFIGSSSFLEWHKHYCKKVTLLAMPLMTTQLALIAVQVWGAQNWYTIISLLIVLLLFILTFFLFTPLHQSIGNTSSLEKTYTKIENANWLRVFLWTLIFLLSVINKFFNL